MIFWNRSKKRIAELERRVAQLEAIVTSTVHPLLVKAAEDLNDVKSVLGNIEAQLNDSRDEPWQESLRNDESN